MSFHAGRWCVFDTSVYITAIQRGSGSIQYKLLLDHLPRTYLCSVVSGELHAGCQDDIGLQLVKQFTQRTEKTGRIVTPTHKTWNLAGRISARIRGNEGRLKTKAQGLFQDVLIALSALQIGATVYTSNKEDFLLIRQYRLFSLKIV